MYNSTDYIEYWKWFALQQTIFCQFKCLLTCMESSKEKSSSSWSSIARLYRYYYNHWYYQNHKESYTDCIQDTIWMFLSVCGRPDVKSINMKMSLIIYLRYIFSLMPRYRTVCQSALVILDTCFRKSDILILCAME